MTPAIAITDPEGREYPSVWAVQSAEGIWLAPAPPLHAVGRRADAERAAQQTNGRAILCQIVPLHEQDEDGSAEPVSSDRLAELLAPYADAVMPLPV